MYLQEILEVVIGVIFAWMLLSIAVLQIQEIIAGASKKRSKDLYKTINKLLDDPEVSKRFFDHPLIQSLQTPPTGIINSIKRAIKGPPGPNNPSYIPTETFSRVLFDIVTKAGTKDSNITNTFQSLRAAIEKLKKGDQETANKLISNLISLADVYAEVEIKEFKDTLKSDLKEEMIETIEKLKCVGEGPNTSIPPLAKFAEKLEKAVRQGPADELVWLLKSVDPYLDQVRKGLIQVGSIKLGETINSLLAGVEESATGADKAIAVGRKNVERWFDNSMERLAGSYKRWAQVWAFVIGFVIAILFNVDSLYMAQELWRNPATRLASSTYIQNYIQEKAQETASEPSDTAKDMIATDLAAIQSDIQALNFPAGWKIVSFSHKGRAYNCGLFDQDQNQPGFQTTCYLIANFPKDAWGYTSKLFGCLITALAALQGAPFWFDTLKKIVNVRSTGINPIEKPKESPAKA